MNLIFEGVYKALAQFGSPVSPKSSSPSLSFVTLVTVTRLQSPPPSTMLDAPLTNGIHLNGTHDIKHSSLNGDHGDAADSPAIDSPATPVDNTPTSDIKIDVEPIEHAESDVRHDPYPVRVDKLDNASTVPQVATPVDPGERSRSLRVSIPLTLLQL